MLTLSSAATILEVLSGHSSQPPSNNDDLNAHLLAAPHPQPEAFFLRLLPAVLRRPLKAWMEARAYERSLVGLWEVSPHLLDDMGIVLSAQSVLPAHLVAAPDRVIEHIAARAPEQIVAAEAEYPALRTEFAPARTAAADAGLPAFPLASAT